MPSAMHLRAEPGLPAQSAHSLDRAALTLKRHSLLYPPLADGDPAAIAHELSTDVGVVWKSDGSTFDGGDTLLTRRYFALQAMQFRLDQLLQGRGAPHGRELDLFLDSRFDQAYVDAGAYQQLALSATGVLGEPDALPVFFDLGRKRLVVDTSRFFNAGTAQITAAAVHGVVAMAQSSHFMAWLEQQPVLTGTAMADSVMAEAPHALLAAARCVTRYVLTEPGLELTPPAEQLARRVGAKAVVRALLTGAVDETRATVTAFGLLRRQGLWDAGMALA